MGANRERVRRLHSESGVTIYIVAGAMVLLLAVSALAIDLVSLYVARSEAQRAADAAALAGAYVFYTQGCTTAVGGCVAGGAQESLATTAAVNVASKNLVAGQAPSSSSVTTAFSYPNAEEPEISVTVHRDAASGNAMPTFFAKILGVSTADVAATATAEAYNSSGGSTAISVGCIKPFLVPNCDSSHPVHGNNSVANVNCPTVSNKTCTAASTDCQSYFFDPNNNYAIVNPGIYNAGNPSAGGVIGAPWQLHSEASPSQWYLIGFTGNSGAELRKYIETCAPTKISCASPLNTANGKKVGPTDQGINALINADGDGPGNGQDTICSPTTTPACTSTPFPFTGGSNNPNPGLVGKTYYGPSPSVANVVVYDGHALDSGGSTVYVIGFMNLFIQDANHHGNSDLIDTVILTIGGCGTSGNNPPPITTEGTTIPVRLIHQ
ncbi:MAG TPA: pilus assembly protein TadG-related protein [Terriglobia bacterium]|nr:pilus assembly protein TadG-related protein [Terriglobia bacterium]